MKKSSLVVGSLYPATSKGFVQLIEEANDAEKKGFSLMTVVRLEKKLAAVFKQTREMKERTYENFVGGED